MMTYQFDVTFSHLQQQHHLLGNQQHNMMPSTRGGRHRLIGGTWYISSNVPEDQGRYVCSINNSLELVESRTELFLIEIVLFFFKKEN